jgi:hypothetical protein
MNLPALEQSLKSVSHPSATPVADALGAGTASVRGGKVRMDGIDGSSDSTSIAQQVGRLRPRETRVQRGAGGRFEVQAKLNPWVSVLTGKSLTELREPDETPDDRSEHPTQLGVEWRDEAPDATPLREYGDEDPYTEFMTYLEEVDSSTSKPTEKQQRKTRLLAEFHEHLKTLSVEQVRAFGEKLEEAIKAHEKADTLDTAFAEGRAVYRTWHQPGRLATSDNSETETAHELVGADSLNVARDPARFREHKTRSKSPESGLAPLAAIPSSLLYPDRDKNIAFQKDRATATALLPENLYAGFSAFNETVKALIREKGSAEELGAGGPELNEHAKRMRATVTRPVFFDSDDIQSSAGVFRHAGKDKGRQVRKTHSAQKAHHNPLGESLALKLGDPFHSNAIFYQTFSQHSQSKPEEWNEMVVKYRSTGHMAGLNRNIRSWVPGLEANDAINAQMEDSGRYSAEKAKQDALFAEALLVGTDFDPPVKDARSQGRSKTKRKKGKDKG